MNNLLKLSFISNKKTGNSKLELPVFFKFLTELDFRNTNLFEL